MVRVALLADTHGVLDPHIATEALACDFVVHAGDVGAAEVLAVLGRVPGGLVAVRGNNDIPAKWDAAGHPLLESLGLEAELQLPGGTLVVLHGDRVVPSRRRHELLRRRYPQAWAVVYGHSHRQICDRSALPWVLNPGAAGRTRTHGGPSYLRLTATTAGWEVEPRRFALMPAARRRRDLQGDAEVSASPVRSREADRRANRVSD